MHMYLDHLHPKSLYHSSQVPARTLSDPELVHVTIAEVSWSSVVLSCPEDNSHSTPPQPSVLTFYPTSSFTIHPESRRGGVRIDVPVFSLSTKMATVFQHVDQL